MPGDDLFQTATMAKVHSEQGNYAEAAAIYRRLLNHEPDRVDLKQALGAVEKKMAASRQERLTALLSRWIDLIFECKRQEALKRAARLFSPLRPSEAPLAALKR
jgi:hypothetical protein